MPEVTPFQEGQGPSIQFFTEYGVHETPSGYIVSEPTYEEAIDRIRERDFGSRTVVLPELITVAGKDFSHIPQYKDDVQRNLDKVRALSQEQPTATFIVGSPVYVPDKGKPYNGVYVIKDGLVQAISHKRMASLGEEQSLTMDLQSQSVTFDQGSSGALICKDLVAASFANRSPRDKEDLFEFFGGVGKDQARQMSGIKFIDESVQRLFVPTCWGVGINPLARSKFTETQNGIDTYYRNSVGTAVKEVLRIHPNLRQIIVSDRAPISSNPLKDCVTSKPMSLIANR